LAGAVGPEQAEELALRDLERDAAHGLDLDRPAPKDSCGGPVRSAKVADLDDRGHAPSPGGDRESSCSATSISRLRRLFSSSFSLSVSADAISPSFAACAAVDSS